jgi:tetratricopeptide (TPR) repeat protein
VAVDLAQAFALHQGGNLAEAEALYRQGLEEDAGNLQIRFLLGVLKIQTGRPGEGGDLLAHVAAHAPGHADAAYNLGVARQAENRLAEAVQAYRQAIAAGASHASVKMNLGAALMGLGELGEAAKIWREALFQSPEDAGLLSNLGALERKRGNLEEASRLLEKSVVLAPGFPAAWNNLGQARRDLGESKKAGEAFAKALDLDPAFVEARLNLALALKDQGRFAESLDAVHAAEALAPDSAEAANNRGVLLVELGREDEARAAFERALLLRPAYAEAASNLGNLLLGSSGPAAAIAAYERALALEPAHASARFNRGFCRLLMGDYKAGWPDWEARLELAAMRQMVGSFTQPLWQGGPLAGKTLLLQAEQGFGDTIHMARYARLARAKAGRVLLRCQPALVKLFARCLDGIEVISQDAPMPDHDVWAPVMSLPGRFGTTLDRLPAGIPYLTPDPERQRAWAERMKGPGLKAGLVWRGNPGFSGERHRAPGLRSLMPLFDAPGVRFFALQRGQAREEIAQLGLEGRMADLGQDLDFETTAAQIAGLDLLISTDTAAAHLAGALGQRCWVLLSSAPDWRWHLGRQDSPWYPSLTLFRQEKRGDWTGVAAQAAAALARLARQSG